MPAPLGLVLGLVLLGLVLVPPAPVLPEVLEPLEVPPALELPSSCRQRSFSAPVRASQRAMPVLEAPLEVEGEVLDVLGEVAEGVDDELEPADGLELEPLEVCANDAADIVNSAAAVAVTRIFNVMGFSLVRWKKQGCVDRGASPMPSAWCQCGALPPAPAAPPVAPAPELAPVDADPDDDSPAATSRASSRQRPRAEPRSALHAAASSGLRIGRVSSARGAGPAGRTVGEPLSSRLPGP